MDINRFPAAGLAALISMISLAPFSPASAGGRSQPVPVPELDLERYAGTWYEIAKIPNRFQRRCVGGTMARYTLRDDGRIEVVNSCGDAEGGTIEAMGVARAVDAESSAKLEVSFVSLFGWQLFWGDYWVLALGDEYEYAVVGTPDRAYGWILSRTPVLAPLMLEEAFTALEAQGYHRDRFEMTVQDSGEGEAVMDQKVLIDFSDPDRALEWRAINDGVMGGLSRSTVEMTPQGTALFHGEVSLENNGGFASIRTVPSKFSMGTGRELVLRVRGDGKRYQFRLRADNGFDGVAYQAAFETRGGEWETIRLSLDDFSPTFRGRFVPNAPPLDPSNVRQVGFLIADQQSGPFRLEIERIAAAP